MFNPYVSSAAKSIHPVKGERAGGLEGILGRLGRLESDDLLLLLLVFLLVKEGDQDGLWPLVAVMLYLML